MKKRFLPFLFAACLLCLAQVLCVVVLADAGTKVHVDDVGLTITVPQEYEVFLHGTDADDPRFSKMGIDGAIVAEALSGNVYLSAITEDFSSEIAITMDENQYYKDYNLLGEATVDALAGLSEDYFASMGIDLIEHTTYQHTQALFAVYSYKQRFASGCALQYSTVYDSHSINITFWSYDGDITQADKDNAKSIVDGIVFDKAPMLPAVEETPAFEYTDENSHVSFTVPRNWAQKDLLASSESMTAKFTRNGAPGTMITFAAIDVWGTMSDSERLGFTRADFTDVNLGDETMIELFESIGFTKNNTKKVKYGDATYYTARVQATVDKYGIEVSPELSVFVRINSGWLYQFMYSGAEQGEAYNDLTSLLESVEYPEYAFNKKLETAVPDKVPTQESVVPDKTDIPEHTTHVKATTPENTVPNKTTAPDKVTAPTTAAVQESTEPATATTAMLICALIVLIYIVPVLVYRYAIRRAPAERNAAAVVMIVSALLGCIVIGVLTAVKSGYAIGFVGVGLCSYISYIMLVTGTKSATHRAPSTPAPGSAQASSSQTNHADTQDIVRCPVCQAEVPSNHAFCHKCGYELKKGQKK